MKTEIRITQVEPIRESERDDIISELILRMGTHIGLDDTLSITWQDNKEETVYVGTRYRRIGDKEEDN